MAMTTELLVALVAAAFSAFVTAVINESRTINKIEKIRKSYNLPTQIPFKDKRNTSLLIGLGGTGKTQLIKNILESDNANPQQKTNFFKIYWQTVGQGSLHEKGLDISEYSSNNWYFIADYCGQNIGHLVSSFIAQQKKEYSPLAYGYINSLILIVDLWPPRKSQLSPDFELQSKPSIDRISKHVQEWNDTAIDAVFGLLTKELKYVCLFINKVDLMENRSLKWQEAYKDAFKKIKERIERRSEENDFEFEVILGSAKNSDGVSQLKEKLKKYSIPNVSRRTAGARHD